MATIREYVENKLAKFNLEVSSVEMDVLLTSVQADDSTPCDSDDALKKAKTIIASVIPELLLQPDVTEGGYSLKQNLTGILSYYGMLCTELGLPNKLSPKPTISDASSLW